jgi:hypothetical protein
VIGFGLAGFLILGLGVWTAKRPPSARRTPQIQLLQPTRDTVISGALTLRFATDAALALQPAGWGTGRFHIHALVNGVEQMPAPTDIRAAGNREYIWTFSDLPDSAEVVLVWALPDHRRTSEGASHAIQVRAQRP